MTRALLVGALAGLTSCGASLRGQHGVRPDDDPPTAGRPPSAHQTPLPQTPRPAADPTWIAAPLRVTWLGARPDAATEDRIHAAVGAWATRTGPAVQWIEPRADGRVEADVVLRVLGPRELPAWRGEVQIVRTASGRIQYAELRLPHTVRTARPTPAVQRALTALVLHEWGHVLDLPDQPHAPGTVMHPTTGPSALTEADVALFCARYPQQRPCIAPVRSPSLSPPSGPPAP